MDKKDDRLIGDSVENLEEETAIELNIQVSNQSNVVDPSRPQLTDYQDREVVWFKSRSGWFKGWICKIALTSGDFVRVWCNEIQSFGYLIDSALNIAPGNWVLPPL